MTEFGELMRLMAFTMRERDCFKPNAASYADTLELLAQLFDATSPFEALQEKATDPRVGLTQPVTVAEAEALNAALAACKEFMERYD